MLASVRSASVLGSACTGDSDVPSAIFPHAVVANIPYILPIIPELFFSFFASYYSQIIPVVADIPVYSSDYSGIIL